MSTKLSVQFLFKHRSKFAVGGTNRNTLRICPRTTCISSICRCCTL